MSNLKIAIIDALALRQLVLLVLGDVVSRTLSLMARFAEVGIAETEPLGDVAAEPALELYELCPMFQAFFNSYDITALRTN
jgi:hypothetical protein